MNGVKRNALIDFHFFRAFPPLRSSLNSYGKLKIGAKLKTTQEMKNGFLNNREV
jgi:hypothetical protein